MAPTEPIPNDPGPVPAESSRYDGTGITGGSIVALDALDALGHVSPREYRTMLDYLSGYAPSAMLHAVAFLDRRRLDEARATIPAPVLPTADQVRDLSAADAVALARRMNAEEE